MYAVVVVANDPIPRVSKKFVTKPMTRWVSPGAARRSAASGGSDRERDRVVSHRRTYAEASAPSAISNQERMFTVRER